MESQKYKGEALKFTGHKPSTLVPKLAEELVGHIESRFPDFEDGFIATTCITCFTNWPQNDNELKGYTEINWLTVGVTSLLHAFTVFIN